MQAFFTAERDDVGVVPIVRLAGELDVATAPQLRRVLDALGEQCRSIVLDLADLTFLDAAGLSVLVIAQLRLQRCGAELVLTSPRPMVRRVLAVTDLDQVFALCASEADALTMAAPVGAA